MVVNNDTEVWVTRMRLLEEKRIVGRQLFAFPQVVRVTLHDDASTW